MGACVSSEAEGISFHPNAKGHHISLDGCTHRAERFKSFHHGILFSNRPLRCQEKLWVRVLQDAPHWYGALRLGITSVDPNTIEPSSLPPFACPNLTRLNGFWAVAIPEDMCFPSNLISFWVNRKGQALCQGTRDSLPTVLFSGLPRKTLLWAMLDVYGQTKAIQLLDSKRGKLPEPCNCQPNRVSQIQTAVPNHHIGTSDTSGSPCLQTDNIENMNFCLFLEDEPYCVICQDDLADTQFLPCCHCSFCRSCALKVQSQGACCPLCRQEIICFRSIDPK